MWFIIVPVVVVAAIIIGIRLTQKSTEEKVIKIGAILPLTGNLSVIGEPERISIELFSNIHPGSKVQIKIEDSQGDPKRTVSILNQLAHVDGIRTFVVSTSPSILSSIPIMKEINGILFAVTSTPDLTDGKYVFQICPNSRDEMVALARWMKEQRVDSVAFVYPNNEFGQMIWDIFSKRYHGVVTFSEAYQLGSTDLRSLITKLKDKQPRWVSFQGYPNDIPVFIKQARELGINSKFITSLATTWPSTVKNLDVLREYPVFMAPTVMLEQTRSSEAYSFYKNFVTQSGSSPNWDAYYTYEILQILRNFSTACKKCDTDELRLYLIGTVHRTISGETRVDQNGISIVELAPATIQNGEITRWTIASGR